MINLHILKMQIFHELPWQPFFKNPCNFVKKKKKNRKISAYSDSVCVV